MCIKLNFFILVWKLWKVMLWWLLKHLIVKTAHWLILNLYWLTKDFWRSVYNLKKSEGQYFFMFSDGWGSSANMSLMGGQTWLDILVAYMGSILLRSCSDWRWCHKDKRRHSPPSSSDNWKTHTLTQALNLPTPAVYHVAWRTLG